MTDVKRFIAEGLLRGSKDISASQSLFSGCVLDSMNLVELIGFLETSYGFRVTPSEVCLENFDSLEKIEHFINRKRSA